MPKCGSQIVLCDLPVRFDTYVGCSHACRYCFASRKLDISNVRKGESAETLKRWVAGERSQETAFADWEIPLHWGGMSDPFQPCERQIGNSLAALKVFADSGYPFAVSTKNKLLSEGPYLDLIKRCNAVVQFSACSPRYDRIETGASTFEERLRAAEKIAKTTRVNIRVQPYIPGIFHYVIAMIPRLANIGVYGIVIEGMKYTKAKVPGLIQVGNDLVYPVSVLLPQFRAIRAACHKAGLRFYCGENRLRVMGDDLCCCGVDGMGWKVNTANLNHIIFAPGTEEFTPAMEKEGGCGVFSSLHQNSLFHKTAKNLTFREQMMNEAKNPTQFMEGGGSFTEKEGDVLREKLNEALRASGLKRSDVDRHLGTNGMAGHYFGRSQWMFPTAEAYEKMRQIMPLPPMSVLFESCGIKRAASTSKIIMEA